MTQRLTPISSRKLIKLLKKLGFNEVRIRGSHHFFYHSQSHLTTTVPVHGSEDISRGLLRKILQDIEITPEEFRKLRK